MKEYISKTETFESVVLNKRACDICGAAAKPIEWGGLLYDVNETEIEITIRHKDGTEYPEGGSGSEYAVDMCPTCFKDKLIPWLESQGCKAKRIKWDW